MELGSKWQSYKATPAEDGLATAVRAYVCVFACVSYGQQKC